MPQPKISVLVPVFNGEEYLAECLESVLVQKDADFELLVSDNASTDRTWKIVEEFARRDARIRAWRNAENVGMVGNFNICMQAARGDYLKFVLADDKLIKPHALQTMAKVLDQNPSVSLLASASDLIDSQSQLLGPRNFIGKSGVYDGKKTIVRCLEAKSDNIIGEPSVTLFRRSQASRGFDPAYRHLLDIEMWYHLLEVGQFAFVEESLCAFRFHAKQVSQFNLKTNVGAQEQLAILETYLRRPWMREQATAKLCVVQARKLRKNPFRERKRAMTRELKKLAGPVNYTSQWLQYSLSRPLHNLGRFMRKSPGKPAPARKS